MVMSFLSSIIKPLAYFSLPFFLVQSLANSSMPGRYYARVVIYVGTLMAVGSCGVVVAAGMSLIGRSTDVNFIVARVFYGLASRFLDIKVEVEGEENLSKGPAVFMANHQSMLDVLIIGRLMPMKTAIMSKKSLQFSPLGPFMTMSGTIFIDRGNNARAVRSVEAAGERMKKTRTSLWIYPEGTRHMSQTPDMLPLKKGGFHLAINAGIPIIPIVAENYWRIYSKGIFNSGTIKVRVLPPISTADLAPADVGSFANRTRDQMLEALREISDEDSTSEKNNEKAKPASDPSTMDHVAHAISPSLGVTSDSVENVLSSGAGSNTSPPSSVSSSRSQLAASDNGAETEEDEGMILVGRPNTQ